MALTQVKVENTRGSKYTLRITNAETGEEVHATHLEIVYDLNIDEYVARIDMPMPILDIVAPVEEGTHAQYMRLSHREIEAIANEVEKVLAARMRLHSRSIGDQTHE